MQQIHLTRLDNETLEQCLWRLGSLKKSGTSEITWNHITDFLNDEFNLLHGESAYRKKYKRLARAAQVRELEAVYEGDYAATTRHQLRELEKQRIRVQEERAAYRQQLRTQAYSDALLEQLVEAVKAYDPINLPPVQPEKTERVLYAMLSDIHFGLSFSSYYNSYNPEIASRRVMLYADRICEKGKECGASSVCVAILGDLISGNIHLPIRLQSRGNAIEQVVGVSELISAFLLRLAENFSEVVVTDVSGNHSRLDPNPEHALRSERLDALIPWYCQARLSQIKHVRFLDNEVDPTISVINILGKTYVAVHGDFDQDLKSSAVRIAQLIDKKIDYFLAGHMHIADMRIEDVGFIRNGAVVTGGDEYTSKKRLFGPAAQVCLLCTPNGVEAVYPIVLK